MMKAVVVHAPRDIRVEEWPTPIPGPGEVRVAVRETGICAGDMYIYQGKNPYVTYPQIGGHEIAGVVDMVGEEVNGIKPGQAVVVEPFLACGTCYPCRIGKSNCCANLEIIGIHTPGGFAEYVTAPLANIHPIPAGLSLDYAAFAEPVAIGVQANRRAEVSEQDWVLVLGCGPIGLAVIEVAKARGAEVVAVDTISQRIELAKTLGAKDVIDASKVDTLSAVMDMTHGEGAPVVMEATGNPKVMESTVDFVAAGGRICIIGLVDTGVEVSFPGLDFTRKEMTIVGSRASVNCFPEALDLIVSGKVTYPKFAKRYLMWDAPGLFKQLDEGATSVTKAVLTI